VVAAFLVVPVLSVLAEKNKAPDGHYGKVPPLGKDALPGSG